MEVYGGDTASKHRAAASRSIQVVMLHSLSRKTTPADSVT
jgi:hypothetical protein